jgi:hypothetical protein
MKSLPFTLQPFAKDSVRPLLYAITGAISRRQTGMALTYNLTGPLQDLVIAPPVAEPARRWLLWETTCLEFFLAIRGADPYWEFNLSPAGHWNVFRLTSYRQGIQEEPAFQALPFTVARQPDRLRLSLDIDLAAIIPADQPLEVGLSTVLQHQGGELSFWALTHPGGEPDFHLRQGFVMKL